MDDQHSNSWHSRPDAAEMVEAITKLLMAFRDRPTDPKAIVTIYCEEFANLPLGVIDRVCRRFRTGCVDGHNPAFAPSVAEMWTEIDRMREADREHARLTRTGEFMEIAGPAPEPMPPIERGYHPSWDILAEKGSRTVGAFEPFRLDPDLLAALPDAKRRGEAA